MHGRKVVGILNILVHTLESKGIPATLERSKRNVPYVIAQVPDEELHIVFFAKTLRFRIFHSDQTKMDFTATGETQEELRAETDSVVDYVETLVVESGV